jgi:hypothetical protein
MEPMDYLIYKDQNVIRYEVFFRYLLLLLVFILTMLFNANAALRAQTIDSIEVKNRALSRVKYYRQGKPLDRKSVRESVSANIAAYPLFKKGTGQQTWADIISGVGGFLIGWEVGNVLTGRNANLVNIGIGFSLAGISIPLYSGGSKKINSAIAIHNGQATGFNFRKPLKTKLSAGVNEYGLQLKMQL